MNPNKCNLIIYKSVSKNVEVQGLLCYITANLILYISKLKNTWQNELSR